MLVQQPPTGGSHQPDGSGHRKPLTIGSAEGTARPISAWQTPLRRDHAIAAGSSSPQPSAGAPAGPSCPPGGARQASASSSPQQQQRHQCAAATPSKLPASVSPPAQQAGSRSTKSAAPPGPRKPPAAAAASAPAQAPAQQASTIESLPPDVLHRVLLGGSCRDAASLKLASKRLCGAVRGASSYWAPIVEARMRSSPHLAGLWARLKTTGRLNAPGASGGGGRGGDSIDWLQVWCCLERGMQGPWAMDVTQLSRRAAPHGVLLVFEVLLQHVPPSADPAAAAAAAASQPPAPAASAAGGAPIAPGRAAAPVGVQQHAWKDNVSVLSFSLDGRRVEVVVDTSGRCGACHGQLVWAGRGAARMRVAFAATTRNPKRLNHPHTPSSPHTPKTPQGQLPPARLVPGRLCPHPRRPAPHHARGLLPAARSRLVRPPRHPG